MRLHGMTTTHPRRLAAAAVTVGSLLVGGLAAASTSGAAQVWSAPTTVGQVDGSTSMQLATAGQSTGRAVVAWTTGGRILTSVRAPSGGWTAALAVSASTETASSPAVAIRTDGAAILVWAARRSADSVIESSILPAGGSWTAPRVVSAAGLAASGPVQVGIDGSGTTLAAWAQISGSVRSVTSASLSPSSTWSSPVTVGVPIASSIRQVAVGVNKTGAAVIGWVRVAGDLYGDVVTRAPGASFGAPVTIANGFLRPLQNQIHQFHVAIDPTGRASAAWNTVLAWAAVQRADGTWSAAAFPNTGRVGGIDLAMDATGTAQLVWSDSGQMKASTLSAGGTWTAATAVLVGSSPVDLVLTPAGTNVVAGWYDSTTTAITTSVHTAAGWGTASKVSALSPAAWIAGVSTAPVGSGALVAWISGTTTPGTVRVSIGTP